jgi:nitronate monooxygenase
MATSSSSLLQQRYPWLSNPIIIAAPMRTISGPHLTAAVSLAGGFGFFGAGYEIGQFDADLSAMAAELLRHRRNLPVAVEGTLPIGVGFILFPGNLDAALAAVVKHRPAAVWLFAPRDARQLEEWVEGFAREAPWTGIWVQVSSVGEAEEVLRGSTGGKVEVVVAQGVADSGGHGRSVGGSVVSLVPELVDAIAGMGLGREVPVVAAGGIVDGRGVAAALVLGAGGAALGTRFVATEESEAKEGFKKLMVRQGDGGVRTVRTRVFDEVRGTGFWPAEYGGRGVANESWREYERGVSVRVLEDRYRKAEEDDDWGRLTAFT